VNFPPQWSTKSAASEDWLSGFISRNPVISIRIPEATSLGRAKAARASKRQGPQQKQKNHRQISMKQKIVTMKPQSITNKQVPTKSPRVTNQPVPSQSSSFSLPINRHLVSLGDE
jgi:hypothetical protein